MQLWWASSEQLVMRRVSKTSLPWSSATERPPSLHLANGTHRHIYVRSNTLARLPSIAWDGTSAEKGIGSQTERNPVRLSLNLRSRPESKPFRDLDSDAFPLFLFLNLRNSLQRHTNFSHCRIAEPSDFDDAPCIVFGHSAIILPVPSLRCCITILHSAAGPQKSLAAAVKLAPVHVTGGPQWGSADFGDLAAELGAVLTCCGFWGGCWGVS